MMKWSYWLGYILFQSAARALFGMRVIGRENLVTEGPVLLAANHESFLDPPLIGLIYPDEVRFLARKSLFKGLFGPVIRGWNAVPIDQDRPDIAGLKGIIKRLRQGEKVLVFPEGQRTVDGELAQGQPGIGLIVSKAGAPVQPIRISGARQALPRGTKRLRFHPITVSIGKPLRFTDAQLKAMRGRDGHQKIADQIMEAVAEL
jgi:1-acyl-sn-glycerol-3-phosphate acyltransferase